MDMTGFAWKTYQEIPKNIINRREKQTNEDTCIVKVSEQHSMSLKYNECIQTSFHRMV